MAPPDSTTAPVRALHDYVEAFEQAQLENGSAHLTDFLPPREQPLYLPVLRELVRVDLEYGWKRRQPRGLDDYRQRFPCLFDDPASLRDITFEEFRLRKPAGQAPTPAEYRERYGIDPGEWPGGRRDERTPPDAVLGDAALAYREFRLWQAADPEERAEFAAPPDDPAALLFLSLHAAQPDAADQLAQALTQLPEVGSDFLGFRLLGELGRGGAFGKVYLARQGDLADRLVALEVTSDLSGEWQTLAQLQHTHIVPIYSVHRGPAAASRLHALPGFRHAGRFARRHHAPENAAGLRAVPAHHVAGMFEPDRTRAARTDGRRASHGRHAAA